MGGRISRRILAAGYSITGYDRDAAQLERAGVDAAASVEDVVGAADVVLLSLPDSNVVEAVVLGTRGILETSRAGQIVVDLSTAAPSSTRQLHARLAERGVELVDAGIS